MIRKTKLLGWTALSLGLAAAAFAQSEGTSGQAQSSAQTQAQDTKQIESQVKAEAAVHADAEVQKEYSAIREKGAKASADSRAKAEAKLTAAASKVDETARAKGDATIASNLAAEYRMTSDQLMAEKSATGATWGDVTIAHTLNANTTSRLTAEQILQLNKEGTGWGQIAAGLGFQLNDAVKAVDTECKVASGAARADGKVAVIRGPDARVGIDGAVRTGVNTAGLDLAAHTGVNAGVKIKP